MTLQEIRVELTKQGKTSVWLASKLGYSTKYMYDCIKRQKEKEIDRIKKILENN